MRFLPFTLLFALIFSCSPKKESNFDVENYSGVTLDGKEIRFSEIPAETVAINVYSPTCVPCVKEIQALNFIYSGIQNSEKIKFFLVVDPYTIIENSENMPFEEVYKKASAILKEDASKRKILLPVLIMKRPFKVLPEGGLITGTPETLLFRTSPLRLYYNFVGPISEEQNPVALQKDAKIQFFKKMTGG